jgi:AcrR family transcriptional regulator
MAGQRLRKQAADAAPARLESTAPAKRPARRTRLSGQDRRSSILSAATMMFAEHGFDGTRTLQIAQAAGVSEALLYRHFPSKLSLYRAVLRQLVVEQNATFSQFGEVEPSAAGLIAMLYRAIRHAMQGSRASNAGGMRLLVGSLAGDGGYARLVYRRSARLSLPGLRRALAAAQAEGAFVGDPVAPENISAFVEHIGTMMMLARIPAQPVVRYASEGERLVRDAVLFCARGIGLREAIIRQHLQPIE